METNYRNACKRWKNKKYFKRWCYWTLMSNYGLEKFLRDENIEFIRSKVGDRYVKENNEARKFNLEDNQDILF